MRFLILLVFVVASLVGSARAETFVETYLRAQEGDVEAAFRLAQYFDQKKEQVHHEADALHWYKMAEQSAAGSRSSWDTYITNRRNKNSLLTTRR